MTLEQEQFQRYRPDFSRLIPYGFEPTEEGYCISRELMDGDFRADITVHTDGSVTGRVMVKVSWSFIAFTEEPVMVLPSTL